MDKERREVVFSTELLHDLNSIFNYGIETFGIRAAESFLLELLIKLENLQTEYEVYPMCRFLPTKSKSYRNLFLGSYVIIYRITTIRIEVLRAFHKSRSVKKIKSARKIRP